MLKQPAGILGASFENGAETGDSGNISFQVADKNVTFRIRGASLLGNRFYELGEILRLDRA